MNNCGVARKLATRLFALVLLFLGLYIAAAVGQEADLQQRIREALADTRLQGATVGVHVVALGTGRVLFSRNPMKKFSAASNQKLVTAATALSCLGEVYEFQTLLRAHGNLAGGALQGDLILEGRGDPCLGGRVEQEGALDTFEGWARLLKEGGVKSVGGDIIAHDLFFDAQYVHPDWPKEQLWKRYCAPVSALSANDNCVQITCKPGARAGQPALIAFSPDVAFLQLRNRCKTSSSRHAIWFSREGGSRLVTVGGQVSTKSGGYSGEVTVPEPALYAAALLKEALRREGIPVEGQVRLMQQSEKAGEPRWPTLATKRSPLLQAMRVMLKRSHNLYAEQVIKTVGAESSGSGSWGSGLAEAEKMLRRIGFSADEFDLADGSGLSHNNRLTPALLTALLAEADRSDWGVTLRSLLPNAGTDGTLEQRLKEAPYRGNIQAKTGYIYGTGTLSGYARARSGLQVAFSILINDFKHKQGNYAMKQIEDSICRAIVDCAQ